MTAPGRRDAAGRADQTTVRRTNLGVVLRHVATRGRCSRARIASETGLTRGTVSSLVSELIDLRLLRETGEDESPGSVGRPAQVLELDDHVVGVGLEINVDYLAVWAEDLVGRLQWESRVHVDNRSAAPEPVLDRLAEMALDAIDVVSREGRVVAGVAAAVPGLADVHSGVLLRAPNLGWTEVDVAAELGARLGSVAVQVENEANLAALAEHRMGVARGVRSFLCVFGEVGVGAGIFVDGELFRGAHGFGGEFGHISVRPDGLPCKCGATGCIETFAGLEAIARRAEIVLDAGSQARDLTRELFVRAEAGHPAVLESLRDTGRCLGVGLASAVNLFDVEVVVLGGCFGSLARWLVDDVRAVLDERVLSSAWSDVEVRVSEFGEGAAVRGAAAVTLMSVLSDPSSVSDRVVATPARLS